MEFFENSNIDGRIVYYYMDGCPACQQFEPIWEEFEKQYKGLMSLEKIEQSQAGNDLNAYNIKGSNCNNLSKCITFSDALII